MANERLVVEVRSDGARTVKRDIEDIGRAAGEASPLVDELKGLLAQFGIALGLAELVREFSAVEQAMNRVRALSGAGATEFARLSAAAREMGSTTDHSTLEAAEALAAMTRQGETATQTIEKLNAASRLATISQTDLKSAASTLADVMRGFGLATDQAGHVADILAVAIEKTGRPAAELAQELRLIGPLAEEAGVSFVEAAADLITLERSGVEGRRAISGLIEVFAPGETALKTFSRQGRIAFNILNGEGAEAVRSLKDQLAGATGESERLSKELDNNLVNQAKTLKNSVVELVQTFTELFTAFGLTATNLGKVSEAVRQFKSYVDAIKGEGSDFSLIDQLLYGKGNDSNPTATLKRINDAADLTRKLKAQNDAAAKFQFQGPQQSFSAPVPSVTAAPKPLVAQIDELTRFNAEIDQHITLLRIGLTETSAFTTGIDILSKTTKTSLESLRLNDDEELKSLVAKQQTIELLTAEKTALDGIAGPHREALLQQTALNELFGTGKINVDEYDASMAKLAEDLVTVNDGFGSVAAQFKKIDTSAKAVGAEIGTSLVSAVDRASGALADFAISGFRNVDDLKKALSSLLSDIAKQIVQIIIKTLVLKAIQAGLNGLGGAFSGGGATGAGTGVSTGGFTEAQAGFATGGDVYSGHPVLVGERGPEIFNPPANGSITPNNQIGGGSPQVNVSIVNVTDPKEVTSAINSAEGQKVILNVLQQNKEALRQMVA